MPQQPAKVNKLQLQHEEIYTNGIAQWSRRWSCKREISGLSPVVDISFAPSSHYVIMLACICIASHVASRNHYAKRVARVVTRAPGSIRKRCVAIVRGVWEVGW